VQLRVSARVIVARVLAMAVPVFHVTKKFVKATFGWVGDPLAHVIKFAVAAGETILTHHGRAVASLFQNGSEGVGVCQRLVELVVPNRFMALMPS
jgi:hypothetical protein